jgi:DMSO/TMAO reductase YedYZ molybdopterin-dependent catalytic subunit
MEPDERTGDHQTKVSSAPGRLADLETDGFDPPLTAPGVHLISSREEITMDNRFVSRGFKGRRAPASIADRVPPGQYVTSDFPVLSAGPTPHVPLAQWSLSVEGLLANPVRWSWDEFLLLPAQTFTVDIHCVTKWSKLDTRWEGVSLDTIFRHAPPGADARFVMAHCHGGYTTNLPIADLTGGKAFIAYRYNGEPLSPAHGGPARLVVPHLYFWKSAKWVRRLELIPGDRLGFWEQLGYHRYGDPWKEQRYSGVEDADDGGR